jgi:hypothetical protein
VVSMHSLEIIQRMNQVLHRLYYEGCAVEVATLIYPQGCRCEPQGDWCEWHDVYNSYLDEDEVTRKEILRAARGG